MQRMLPLKGSHTDLQKHRQLAVLTVSWLLFVQIFRSVHFSTPVLTGGYITYGGIMIEAKEKSRWSMFQKLYIVDLPLRSITFIDVFMGIKVPVEKLAEYADRKACSEEVYNCLFRQACSNPLYSHWMMPKHFAPVSDPEGTSQDGVGYLRRSDV